MGQVTAILLAGLLIGSEPTDSVVVRIPVDAGGRIEAGELMARLADAAGFKIARPEAHFAIPVRGPAGLVTRALLAQTLGPGVEIEVGADELVLRVRPERLARENHPRLRARLATFRQNTRLIPPAPPPSYGFQALGSYRANDPDRVTICLIHGINSTSGSFVHVIPALEAEGFGVVVYNYPYDRDLDEMADVFPRDWASYRRERGEKRPWVILTHSMGSLVARSYVEGDKYLDDVSHLFLIGPTNRGAAVAKGQKLLRLAKRFQPPGEKRDAAIAALGDSNGAAAEDLLPGSAFLERLNGRARREGVAYHILAGSGGFLSKKARGQLETYLATASNRSGLAGGLSRIAAAGVGPALDELCEGTGDGCVALASTRLDGVTDHETIPANHVELIRGPLLYPDPGPVACMPFVVKRLKAKPIEPGR